MTEDVLEPDYVMGARRNNDWGSLYDVNRRAGHLCCTATRWSPRGRSRGRVRGRSVVSTARQRRLAHDMYRR